MKRNRLVLAAAALSLCAAAKAGEDRAIGPAWCLSHGIQWCPAADDASAPPEAVAKPVPMPEDRRITDGTVAFDDSKYPTDPVAAMVFWGFDGAKTAEGGEERRLCDADAAVMEAKIKKAASSAGLDAGQFRAAATILENSETYCSSPSEDGNRGRARPVQCSVSTTHHCAFAMSAGRGKALLYKRLPPLAEASAAVCAELLASEKKSALVVDSKINDWIPGPTGRGCTLQVLELVPAY